MLVQLISILSLLFSAKAVSAIGVCTQREMACGAQIRSYPLLRPEKSSKQDVESDMEDFPLYDESFTPEHIFNFSKAANLSNERICQCPNNTSCDLKEENIIKLDEMIVLVFCDRIDDIFRRACRGERSLIRVIGRIDESGEALTTVDKTFLFCKCERGYQRVYVEDAVSRSIPSCDVDFAVGERMHPRKAILDINQIISHIFLSLLLTTCSLSVTKGHVIPLNEANIQSVLRNYEIVFVNFYADWCRFSQQLKPIFEEASNRFGDRGSAIAWAIVDCDREADIAQKYHVSKYPTLKLFRSGELVKKEYRGQRSVDALSIFVEKQLIPSIQNFTSNVELNNQIDLKKLNIIAYFDQAAGPEFDNYRKVASLLREDCVFWLGIGERFQPELAKGNRLEFRPLNSNERFEYTGGLANLETLKQWVVDKCVPLVREITFENAEELTEEGLPFLILFRHPDDTQSDKIFVEQVARELFDQKSSINCLFADGTKFLHPLQHLGKTINDLPVLAVDSFRHMYLFPDMKSLTIPGKLRQFILDLHSGKLHREFHHGPDPTQAPSLPTTSEAIFEKDTKGRDKSQPPTSVFKQLKPSESRYSLLNKDEL